MKNDISNRVILIILLIAIVVSVASTWTILDEVSSSNNKIIISNGRNSAFTANGTTAPNASANVGSIALEII